MTLLLKNARVLRGGKFVEENVLCDAEITRISRQEINAAYDEKLEGHGLVLLPGVIDSHVHFRSAGCADSAWDYKEDFASGGAAAAAGGVTSVVDMPNCVPPTTSAQRLKEKLEAAHRHCPVNYYAHFGVESKDEKTVNAVEARNAAKEGRLNFVGLKVFMGSSTGPLLVQGEALESAFKLAVSLDKRVLVHAELEELVKHFKEIALKDGVTDHNAVRPPKCALEATREALRLAEKSGTRLHVCHLNCAEEIVLLGEAKKKGVAVSSEATPHHLFLNAAEAARIGNNAKVNPPIRSESDRAAVFRAFASGAIDFVASDHAPHCDYEKAQDYWKAPSGFPGVETMLPLLLNAVNEKKLSLERVVEATSALPAKINGFDKKGFIEKGRDADFVLVDLKLEAKVRGEELHGKSKWTPFDGRKLAGWPVATVASGEIVFERE